METVQDTVPGLPLHDIFWNHALCRIKEDVERTVEDRELVEEKLVSVRGQA